MDLAIMNTRRSKGRIRGSWALFFVIPIISIIITGCDGIVVEGGGAPSIGIGAINATAIQTDGKIVVAGEVVAPAGGTDLALVRYKTDGTLDTAFGLAPGGIVTTTP